MALLAAAEMVLGDQIRCTKPGLNRRLKSSRYFGKRRDYETVTETNCTTDQGYKTRRPKHGTSRETGFR
jgi:hypothetical protein